MRPLAVLLAAAALAAAADDDAPPPGMDILPLVKDVAAALTAKEPPLPGRPWSDDLAALTDADPSVNGPAVGRLTRRGAAVLPDLAILAGERDWQLRGRIVRVAAGIGGEAGAELVLRLAADPDPRVRRLAIVGLGRCRGQAVLDRLLALIAGVDGDERAMAAASLSALGDPRAIEPLTRLRGDADGPARSAQAKALRELCALERSAPACIELLGRLAGEQRRALLEALDGAVDPRLCPPLARLIDEREPLIVLLAVRALATAGDARAVGPLVALAASERLPELREAAATTLRVLTPYRAGPGKAWALWWNDNAARYARLAERDGLIAGLADGTVPPGLSGFTPEELLPLVDAAIVARPVPAWLPPRALAALRAQAGEPWVAALAKLIEVAPDAESRLDLLLLLDEIGGPGEAAIAELRRQQMLLAQREDEALARWKKDGVIPPDTAAERALLKLALDRR